MGLDRSGAVIGHKLVLVFPDEDTEDHTETASLAEGECGQPVGVAERWDGMLRQEAHGQGCG